MIVTFFSGINSVTGNCMIVSFFGDVTLVTGN